MGLSSGGQGSLYTSVNQTAGGADPHFANARSSQFPKPICSLKWGGATNPQRPNPKLSDDFVSYWE